MGSPPTTFRTLAGLSEGQTPVFAKCPAHAGTGATPTASAAASHPSSGPRGHRGNVGLPAERQQPTVRPTRAQGQRSTFAPHAPASTSGPRGHRGNYQEKADPCRPRLRAPHHPAQPGQLAVRVGQIGGPGSRPSPGLGAVGQNGGQQIAQGVGGDGGIHQRAGVVVLRGFPGADRLTSRKRPCGPLAWRWGSWPHRSGSRGSASSTAMPSGLRPAG